MSTSSMEFPTIPLSQTTKFIVDNRGKTAPTAANGIPLIATNCIDNNQLYPVFNNIRYVSQETYENWFRSHPEPNDIILTLKGSQNGAACLVPDPVGFAIAQDMVALRVDETRFDSAFLLAALRSQDVQCEIKNLDVSGVIPHLKKSDFDKLNVPNPPLAIQKVIGKIYLDFCLKIDLLHRQNKTLEAMAETLFRQQLEASKATNGSLGSLISETLGGDWGTEAVEGDSDTEVRCVRGTDLADLRITLPRKTPIRFIKRERLKKLRVIPGDIIFEISGGTETQSTGRSALATSRMLELFDKPLVFSNFCRLLRPLSPDLGVFLYFYLLQLYDQDEFFALDLKQANACSS